MKFYIAFCRVVGIMRIALIYNHLQYAVFWPAICGLSACNMPSFSLQYAVFRDAICGLSDFSLPAGLSCMVPEGMWAYCLLSLSQNFHSGPKSFVIIHHRAFSRPRRMLAFRWPSCL